MINDIQTAVSPNEQQALARLAKDALVLELGSWKGASTVAMATAARRVHAVDWHGGDEHAGFEDTLSEFAGNLERYQVRDRVVTHVGRFEDVLAVLADRTFDLVFLDGFHTHEAVVCDLELALPKLAARGRIALHDYGRFGVQSACDQVFKRSPLELVETVAVFGRSHART